MPFYIRTGKCLPVDPDRGAARLPAPAAARLLPEGTRRPEPDQIVVKLDPTTGIRMLVEAERGDGAEPERITLDMEFADEGGEGATPYEVLLRRRDARRRDALHAPGRRRGAVADHAAAARRPAASARRTRRAPGDRRPADEMPAEHGGWHGPWVAS